MTELRPWMRAIWGLLVLTYALLAFRERRAAYKWGWTAALLWALWNLVQP